MSSVPSLVLTSSTDTQKTDNGQIRIQKLKPAHDYYLFLCFQRMPFVAVSVLKSLRRTEKTRHLECKQRIHLRFGDDDILPCVVASLSIHLTQFYVAFICPFQQLPTIAFQDSTTPPL